MTTYTTTLTGECSTVELDVMFAELQAMKTTDAYGRPDALKTAQMYEYMFDVWYRRNLSYGDGSGMMATAKRKAAEWYRKHAEEIENW